jgi:hypothetical protein
MIQILESENIYDEFIKGLKSNSYLIGKNGNIVVYINWISTYGIAHNDYEGGIIPKRISDWINADTCHYCGRKIVHVFHIYDIKKKQVYSYGKDHANFALGFQKELNDKQVVNMYAEVKSINRQKEIEKKDIPGKAKKSIDDIRFNFINRGFKFFDLNKGIKLYFNNEKKLGILYPKDYINISLSLAYEELGYIKYIFQIYKDFRQFLLSKGLE